MKITPGKCYYDIILKGCLSFVVGVDKNDDEIIWELELNIKNNSTIELVDVLIEFYDVGTKTNELIFLSP